MRLQIIISKTICLYLLLINSSVAQIPFKDYSIKCTYNLSFQPDSNSQNKSTEVMLLLISGTESLFMASNSFLYDSVSYQNFLTTGSSFGDMSAAMAFSTKLKYKIVKNNGLVNTYDKINKTSYMYQQKLSTNWIVDKDTATISGISCQKATLNFGGRDWIAWFAPSIPITDGPYKFAGLPGLIIKMNDSKNGYIFTLTSMLNVTGVFNTVDKPIYKNVTKQEFFKAADFYKKNKFELDQLDGVKFTSGQEVIKKRLKEAAERDNNPIEF